MPVRTSLVVLVVLLATFITACGGSATDTGSVDTPSESDTTTETSPGETVTEVFRLGTVTPVTGAIPQHGEYSTRGLTLAIEDIKAQNLVPGEIELLVEDGQNLPRESTAAFTKLATVHEVQFVETVGSPVVLALGPLANQYEVVLMNTAAKHPDIRNLGEYVFSITSDGPVETKSAAEFIRNELGAQTASVLYVDSEYGLGLLEEFEKYFTELGGTIISKERHEPAATDYRAQLTRLKEANPEVIFLPSHSEEIGHILKQAAELGVESQFLAAAGTISEAETIAIAGSAAEGAIHNVAPFDPNNGTPEMIEFANRYRDRWGVTPTVFSANSYVAGMLYGHAIAAGARTGREIKDFLLNEVKGWDTIIGELTIGPDGHADFPMRFEIVKDGKLVPYGN